MHASPLPAFALALLLAGTAAPLSAAPSSLDRDLAAALCRGKGLIRVNAPTEPFAADFDLAEKLGLLDGHLIIGKALLDAGMFHEALPHFGHPVREIYDYLKPAIASRKIRPYEEQLAALEAQAISGKISSDDFKAALAWSNDLRATIAKERSASPEFQLKHLAQMLSNVADDYGEAQERGLIVNSVEYHDSMGFLAYTEGALAALGNDPRVKAVRAELDKAKAAFPALKPPKKPTVTVARLRNHGDAILALVKEGSR